MEESEVDDMVREMSRPAAIIPQAAARQIFTRIAANSVYAGGLWLTEPSRWVRYDRPWTETPDSREPGRTTRLGIIRFTHGTPSKYEITIFQVAVTQAGHDAGLTVEALADEALAFGSLSLDRCTRATMTTVPKPFRF